MNFVNIFLNRFFFFSIFNQSISKYTQSSRMSSNNHTEEEKTDKKKTTTSESAPKHKMFKETGFSEIPDVLTDANFLKAMMDDGDDNDDFQNDGKVCRSDTSEKSNDVKKK